MDSSRFLWEKGEDALCGTHVVRESTYIRMTRFVKVVNKNKEHAPKSRCYTSGQSEICID